jgi:hypothetical protein
MTTSSVVPLSTTSFESIRLSITRQQMADGGEQERISNGRAEEYLSFRFDVARCDSTYYLALQASCSRSA